MFDSGRDSPDEEDEEGDPVDPDEADVPMDDDDDDDQGVRLPEDSPSLDDSLVIDAFISPLADSQYKSTYAIVANAGLSLISHWEGSIFNWRASKPRK